MNNYKLETLKTKLFSSFIIIYSIAYILMLLVAIISAILIENNVYTTSIILVFLILTLLPILYLFIIRNYLNPLNKIRGYINNLSTFTYYKKKEFTDIEDYKKLFDSIYNVSQLLEETKLNYEQYRLRIDSLNKKREINELKEKDLIYSISHELKTPISIIEAGTYAILDGVYEGNEAKNELNQILKECDLSISMIQSVLDVFKLNRTDFKLHYESLNLKELVQTNLENFSDLFKKYNHTLFTNIEDSFVYADKIQINTVLSNVIQNAITNSKKGSKIFVNIKKVGKETIFEIINSNSSIPEDKLEHIFEPFIKADVSHVKKEHKGNGLGLYIVKQILNKFNFDFGIINIKNGVKFYFIGKDK